MPRPYITISYAQTLDGRIATASGDSQWIGGPESLTFAHELRRDNDAILVGIGTVLRDNPRLTCRIPGGKNPIRVVLDSQLRLPADCALATGLDEAPTWVVGSPSVSASRVKDFESRGLTVALTGKDLPALLEWLAHEGVRSLFVEGGARVITSFFRAGLIDRLIAVTAPFVMGAGVEAIGDLGAQTLARVPRPLRWRRWDLGNDGATELVYREPS